jgi:hypothetical protein
MPVSDGLHRASHGTGRQIDHVRDPLGRRVLLAGKIVTRQIV